MTLDVATLMSLSAILALVVGVGMWSAAPQYSTRVRPAMTTWAAALVCAAIGMAAFAGRGRIPDLLSIVGGNLFASLALALKTDAARRLALGRVARLREYAVVPVTVATCVLLHYVYEAPQLRLALVLAIYAAHLAACVVALLPRAGVANGRAPRLMRALFAINALVLVVRAIYVPLAEPQAIPLLSEDLSNQLLFTNEAVMLVAQTIAIAVLGAAVELRHRDWANQRLAVAFEAAGLSAWRIGAPDPARRGAPDEDLVANVPLQPFERFLERVPIGDREDVARLDELVVGQWHGTVRADVLAATDGISPRWQSLYARPVVVAGGAAPEVIVVSRDIDEERRAQNAARESAARLELMIEAVQMVGWEVDLDAGDLILSGDATRLLGARPTAWSQLRALFQEEDLDRLDREFARVRATREVGRCELRLNPSGANPRVLVMHAALVGDGARMAGFLQDVTLMRHTEQALQATQDYLRRALDASGMVIWEWDSAGARRSFGDDFAIFGCRPRTADEIRALVHPADLARVDYRRDMAVRAGEEYSDEFRVVRPDGDVRWLLLRGRPDIDGSGRLRRLTGVVWDITSRKRAERALEDAQEHLQFVLRSAGMWTWDIDLETRHRRTFGDDVAVLGTSASTIEQFLALVHPADVDGLTAQMKRSVRDVQTFRHEYRVTRADKGVLWLQTVGRPVIGPDGAVKALAGVVIDVSTRKEAELALLDSERLLRLGARAARLNFWSMDMGDGTRHGGELDLEFYGRRCRSAGELLSLLPGEDAARMNAAFDAARAGVEMVSCEYRAVQDDGSVRWFAMLAHTLSTGGGMRLAGVTREITEERERSERLLAAIGRARASSDAKSQFLASMSHELRTPLNGVIGCAELLADETLSPRQTRLVETMSESARHLLGVINDILDYSKIEAGQVEIEAIPMLLRDCVEPALALVAPQAAARGLDLGMTVVGGDERVLLGDPLRLQQIVLNLLSNAVKFTQAGSVVVELDVDARPEEEASDVTITVRDTGVGIDDAVRESIFEPFRQGDASTTRRHGGTGLGLAISERLATAMKGRLDVTSTPGAGAAFTLRLSMRWGEATWTVVGANPWEGRDCWIAVSSPFVRELLHRQLDAWGAFPSTEVPEWLHADTVVITDVEGHAAVAARLALPDAEHVRQIEVVPWGKATQLPAPAGGTTSALYLPLRPSSLQAALDVLDTPRIVVRTPLESDPLDGQPLRLLVAEDNAVNATVLDLMLQSLGHSAEFVDGGQAAIERCAQEHFDVVLMDIEMPMMDGLEATRIIRESTRRTPGPWIVAVTAHVLAESRERILAAGMNDYLAKPVQIANLRRALRRALHARGGVADAHGTDLRDRHLEIDDDALL